MMTTRSQSSGSGSGTRVGSLALLAALATAALLGPVAAAAADTSSAAAAAFVEVVLFESSPGGDYTTYTTGLQGRFSGAGAAISAEGEIVQVSQVSFSFPLLLFFFSSTPNRTIHPPSMSWGL